MTVKENSSQRALRPTLIGAGLLAALGLGLAGYGIHLYVDSKEHHDEIVRATSRTQAELNQKQRDLIQARDYNKRFEALRATGVIGALAKTKSIDRFEQLVKAQPVPLRNYEMGGRLPANVANPAAFQQFVPSRHELRFEAEPLHEQDLLALTMPLENRLPGLTALESCSISRADVKSMAQQLEAAQVPRLTARCKLSWYVFAENESAAIGATLGAAN